MSVEFRKRSSDEYVQILAARKWHILLPAIAVFVAVSWSVYRLPNLYESTTLLTISPPKISEKVAPSLSDADLSQRLESIHQNVVSRTSLEPMITKYNIFLDERNSGTPMDVIIEKMKGHITVDIEKSDERKVMGFRISYRDRAPETTRQITAELANKFVTAQSAESSQSAETTKQFIENQMSQSKASMDALEKQRLEIMTKNVDAIPEAGQGLIAQLSGLRQREETISKEKETLMTELGRVREGIQALNRQVRLIETFGEKETQEAVTQASRVEDTPAYGQLIQRRAELSAKLQNLKIQYRDKHPEIQQTQTDIDKVNDELQNLAKRNDQRVNQAMQSSSRKADLQKQSMGIEKQKAEGQVQQILQQLDNKDREMQRNSVQIGALEAKLNTIPTVRIALEGLNNQYESAKGAYEELFKKYNNAQQQVQVESEDQGETITVVDPANLPQTSVNASKKPLIIGVGAGVGLLLGFLFAFVLEAPKFFRLKNVTDAEHYTGLKVWAAIPPLLSEEEIANKGRVRLTMIFVGAAAAIISIPVLVILLSASRALERFS